MNLRSYIVVFILVFPFFSCEDVVQVKLDEGAELYVVDAFIESKYDLQAIFIHKSSSYFNTQKPEPVVNAQVKLYDLSSGNVFDFFYEREDRYELYINLPHKLVYVPGHQYKLEIVLDGITYYALSTMPRAAKVDSISATRYTKDQFTGRPRPPYYLCTLWAKDKADNNPDYYWIKTSSDSGAFTLCIDGTQGIVTNADRDSLYFAPPFNAIGYRIYPPGSFCYVQVDAITRDTYNFLIQAQSQVNNGGLFAKTPENVKTNFITPSGAKTKMIGWFSMANVTDGDKTLPAF